MTALALVIEPGLQTTVQDAGRPGARHLGAPQSGAADRISFALANVAVGNPWDAPALECTLKGPMIEFQSESAFSLGGAPMAAQLNDTPIAYYRRHVAEPGDRLILGAAKLGARSYIAFAGGLAGDDFLGSVSTYSPARIGGIEGRALKKGDVLMRAGSPGGKEPREIPEFLRPAFGHDWFLRATRGPEADAFDPHILRVFFSKPFTADQRGDRMGLKLNGEKIAAPQSAVMKSSPVFPGVVQAPPGGAPFLLLPDAQTIGGYARIAQVIDADLYLTGQIRPGDRVWFRQVSEEKARSLAAQRLSFLRLTLSDYRHA